MRCDRCQRLLPPELFGRRGSVCEECHAESRKRKAVRCLEIVRAKTKRILREQEIREARARQAAGEREE
ncbi:MAG: hypothetical protein JXR97_12325 [Planctomycetes bacterium]|nr:hypothetical protein [Planctomycetota bacterium]